MHYYEHTLYTISPTKARTLSGFLSMRFSSNGWSFPVVKNMESGCGDELRLWMSKKKYGLTCGWKNNESDVVNKNHGLNTFIYIMTVFFSSTKKTVFVDISMKTVRTKVEPVHFGSEI
jgi:hypothetical protein